MKVGSKYKHSGEIFIQILGVVLDMLAQEFAIFVTQHELEESTNDIIS